MLRIVHNTQVQRLACPKRLDLMPRFAIRSPTAEFVAEVFSNLMLAAISRKVFAGKLECIYVLN